jgi:hypothetical protein
MLSNKKRGIFTMGLFSKKEKKAQKKDKDAPRVYASEKSKIRSFVENLELERAKGYLKVAHKQLLIIQQKKKELDSVLNELQGHIDKLTQEIAKIKARKQEQKTSIQMVSKIERKLAHMTQQVREIEQLRKRLLLKEKKHISDMKSLATANKGYLKRIDRKKASELINLEASKEFIIDEAMHLLNEEKKIISLDNTITPYLTNVATNKIKLLNENLNILRNKKRQVMAKKELLLLSEREANKELGATQTDIERIKKKYKRLFAPEKLKSKVKNK